MSADNCGACRALCCVAHAFDAGDFFASSKSAGVRCPNLRGTRCGIHDTLKEQGFSGCAAYSCFGAGPVVSAFDVDDRNRPAIFLALRTVLELRSLVDAAQARWPTATLAARASSLAALSSSPSALLALETSALRSSVLAELRALAPRVLALRVVA